MRILPLSASRWLFPALHIAFCAQISSFLGSPADHPESAIAMLAGVEQITQLCKQ